MSLPTPAEIAAALIAREEMPPEEGPEGKAGGFGPPGPQGPKGNPGTNGTNGSNGDQGRVGPEGKTGPKGPKGDRGPKGEEGDRGVQGPMGPTGPAGSGRALFPRPGGGSGSALTVKDEGATLSAVVSSINFAGAGVTATNVGPAVTVTVTGGSGASDLETVTVDLTTAQIATLNGDPVEVVAAQGAGTAIVPVSVSLLYFGATEPFAAAGGGLAIKYGPLAGNLMETSSNDLFTTLGSTLRLFHATDDSDIFDDLPLLLMQLDDDPTLTGSALTTSIDDGGTLFLVNDTITLAVPVGGDPVVLVVDAIAVGGIVTAYHITDPGTGYVLDTFAQDGTSGIGTDFALNINTITPLSDGTARVAVVYHVMALT